MKSKKRYEILVLEDNQGDYILVEDFLEETSIVNNVHWAKDFQTAVDILQDSTISIDIILLDLNLPDKDGEDLIIAVNKLSKNKPIIILTGYQDAEFAVKALSLGASDYLLKDVLSATVLHKSILYNLERNKNLVKLKDSEERYSDLFHFSPLPMWVFDRETLKFLDVNDAAIEAYGYSYEEFLSMDITQIRPVEDIPAFNESRKVDRKLHKNLYHGEFTHLKKNGEQIRVEIRSNSFEYKGRPAQIILVNDVTERNRHIEAIEKQNEILKDIAWTQSHVVRAPLSRLMGLLNAMKNSNNMDAKKKEFFYDNIFKSAVELDEIIQSVVNKSQEVDINNNKR